MAAQRNFPTTMGFFTPNSAGHTYTLTGAVPSSATASAGGVLTFTTATTGSTTVTIS